jgi:hypothetical protein
MPTSIPAAERGLAHPLASPKTNTPTAIANRISTWYAERIAPGAPTVGRSAGYLGPVQFRARNSRSARLNASGWSCGVA